MPFGFSGSSIAPCTLNERRASNGRLDSRHLAVTDRSLALHSSIMRTEALSAPHLSPRIANSRCSLAIPPPTPDVTGRASRVPIYSIRYLAVTSLPGDVSWLQGFPEQAGGNPGGADNDAGDIHIWKERTGKQVI